MTDEEKKPPLPDRWFQDAPAPGTPPSKKEKPSTEQDQEQASDQPAPVANQPQEGESQPEAAPKSNDDLLGDVRRELVQEEEAKPKRKWSGIFKRKKKKDEADNEILAVEGKIAAEPKPEIVDVSRVGDRAHVPTEQPRRVTGPLSERKATGPLPQRRVTGPLSESSSPSAPEAPLEAADRSPVQEDILKSILGFDESQAEGLTSAEDEETTVIDKAMRHEILRPEESEQVVDIEGIREEALRDYSDEPLQLEPDASVTIGQKTRGLFRGLRPVEKFLLAAIVVVVVVAGILAVGAVIRSLPTAPAAPTMDPNLPIPEGITLPGGWAFNLEKGQVVEGRWDPAGPEWLEGTELCRWVALPWSTQLEAVVRTLKANDPLELIMSNGDHLTFKVQSIKKVTVDEIETLQTSSTCLLLILADETGDSRWVVTAIP